MEKSHEQKVQDVLDAAKNLEGKKVYTKEYSYAYRQLKNYIFCLNYNSLSTEEAEQILDAMVKAGIKFNEDLLDVFLVHCQSYGLNANNVKMIFNIMGNGIIFNWGFTSLLINFLNACGENSLDEEDLEKIYHSCNKYLFEGSSKEDISFELNETSKKFFQNLCKLRDIERGRERKREKLEKLVKNDKQGISVSIAGIIFGVLLGLVAIAFVAWEISFGALAVITAILMAVPIVVVALALIGIFNYVIKLEENKKTIKLKEEQLNIEERDESQSNVNQVENNLNDFGEPLMGNGNKDKDK